MRGVGGWLAFFVIALCVLGPSQLISSTVVGFSTLEASIPGASVLPAWQDYKLYTWIVIGLVIGLRLLAGGLLTNHFKPLSVRVAISVLWVTPLITSVGTLISAKAAFGAETPVSPVDTAYVFMANIVIAAVWTSYLVKSVRVRNTYYGAQC